MIIKCIGGLNINKWVLLQATHHHQRIYSQIVICLIPFSSFLSLIFHFVFLSFWKDWRHIYVTTASQVLVDINILIRIEGEASFNLFLELPWELQEDGKQGQEQCPNYTPNPPMHVLMLTCL